MPRIAIVHDYLTQRGGAERVALEMVRAFPGAALYTTVFNPMDTFDGFADVDVRVVNWLDRLPAARKHARFVFPVLPLAMRSIEVDADVVLCSSSGWSHGVSTRGKKIVYCHNPARWLYQPDAYFQQVPGPTRKLITSFMRPLRHWDAKAAASADMYVANSRNVAGRIARAYGRESLVVHPPRGLGASGPRQSVPGLEPGYYLNVSRNRGYKRSGDIARAFTHGTRRLVQVGGEPVREASVTRVTGLSDEQLRWLYANARALIAVGDEDFGLTPVECYAFGTPAIVLASGGYLETASPAATVLIHSTDSGQLCAAMDKVETCDWDRQAIVEHAEKWSPATFHQRLRQLVQDVLGPASTTQEATVVDQTTAVVHGPESY